MPTIDEGVKRSARAIFRQSNVNLGNAPNDFDWEGAEQQCRDWNIALAKAALSAFFAEVPKELVEKILTDFGGGVVRVPDETNKRGYTDYFDPIEAMQCALAKLAEGIQ